MDDSADVQEPTSEPVGNPYVVPDGSICFQCNQKASSIDAVLWLYRKCRITGRKVRFRPHPRPYRRCACETCLRTWTARIPKSSLAYRHTDDVETVVID